jgi:hypothetical protein
MQSIVFVHIPRTGGTSLAQALLGLVTGAVTHTDDVGYAAQAVNDTRLIHGHMILDGTYWSDIATQAMTITVLREPVDRIVSLYYRFRLDPGYRFHKELQSMSLADFVRSGQHVQTYQANNDQVRRLSGVKFGYGENCWYAVDRALINLETFDIVGVYGWFCPLIETIQNKAGLELPPLNRISVSTRRLTIGELDPLDLEVIQEYNRLDFILYSAVMKRVAEEMYRQA